MKLLSMMLATSSLLCAGAMSAAATGQPALHLLGEEPVRVHIDGGKRQVEVTNSGTRVTVQDGARSVQFEKKAGGAVSVRITNGSEVQCREFESEAALEKADRSLFELFAGRGFPVRVYGEADPAEREVHTGNAPEYRGGSERMLEFRAGVEAMRRNMEDLARALAAGDLSEEEVNRLSKEARARLERDLQRLEERERENRTERNAEDRKEEEVGITRDRYMASLRALERSLLERVSGMRGGAESDMLRALDDVAGKIKDTYADLKDTVLDSKPALWSEALSKGRKFFDEYSAQLDAWEKKGKEPGQVENPYEDMRSTQRQLLRRVKNLRKPGGDKFESILDNYEDKIKDTYADLFDKLDDEGRRAYKTVAEFHMKFAAQMVADLDKVERQIAEMKQPQRRENTEPREEDPKPETPEWKDSNSPERDIDLPPGEQADIVAGVRVARLAPLVKKHMNLEHGLSVNEIVDPDGLLAVLGLEVYDIILEFNGNKIDTRDGLRQLCKEIKRGDEYRVVILRDGKKKVLEGKR